MWGASFQDLAKKAQEQAEAAAAAAAAASAGTSTSSWSTGGLFNLNAMQQQEEAKIEAKKAAKIPDHERPIQSSATPAPAFSMDSLWASAGAVATAAATAATATATTTTPTKPSVPTSTTTAIGATKSSGGLLKVPTVAASSPVVSPLVVKKPAGIINASSSASPLSSSKKPVQPPPQKPLVQATAAAAAATTAPPAEKDNTQPHVDAKIDGWSQEDDDLDLEDDDDDNGKEKISIETEMNRGGEAENGGDNDSPPPRTSETKAAVSSADATMVDKEPTTTTIMTFEEEDEAVNMAAAVVEKQQEYMDNQYEELHPHEEGADEETDLHHQQQHQQEEEMEEDDDDDAPPTMKLLILCANRPLSRRSMRHQENAYTILKARNIPYETVDGSDAVNVTWRDELFSMSQLRDYPQFFLLNLNNGETTFWGNYDRLEFANDDGTLFDELTGKNTTWQPPHVFDTTAPSSPAITTSASDVSSIGGGGGGAADLSVTAPSSFSVTEVATLEQATTTAVDAAKQQEDKEEKMMEHFLEQMKRLEESHVAERAECERQHKQELENVRNSFNHEGEAQRVKLEQGFTGKLRQKEQELQNLLQTNEGYRLKLDALQREVAGTQQLLEAKGTDVNKANALHRRDLKVLQEQLMEREEKASVAAKEAEKAKASLATTSAQLETLDREHSELKFRVKAIATELKDRRVESRELKHKVEELTEKNAHLNETVERLQLELSTQDMTRSEADGHMGNLRKELSLVKQELEKAKIELKEKDTKAETALNEYKKKAQNSLALANSRTAGAVQAKEEAELEARAARSTADTAMDRAVKAEINSKEAIAEARAYVAEMEAEKNKATQELTVASRTLAVVQEQLAMSQAELAAAVAEKGRLATELPQTKSKLIEEESRSMALQEDLAYFKKRSSELDDQVAALRHRLERAEAAVAKNEEEENDGKQGQDQSDLMSAQIENGGLSNKQLHASNDATIAILQQELREAKDTIQDLKEALTNACELNASSEQVGDEAHQQVDRSVTPADHSSSNNGGDSAPLFYAMEKQAELKTARNEINRLANLLANIQSEKMEAFEARDDMRRRMEDAESRLQRFEKLGAARNPTVNGDSTAHAGPSTTTPSNSAATNIEYLKNIMMRYLKAKSLAERKALVPVIGAVLCLTPEELTSAMQNLEESTSLGSVSTSLFESLRFG